MEGRPERRGTFSSYNPYVHLQTTVLATEAWGVIQHMVKYIKPCFRWYLTSFKTGQGTSGLESPLWNLGHCPSAIYHDRKMRCQGEGETPSVYPSIAAQTLLPSDLHPPSPLPGLGDRAYRSAGTPGGHGAGSWVPAGVGLLRLAPTLPLHAQEGKKIRRQRRKASAAKWLIGFYGN